MVDVVGRAKVIITGDVDSRSIDQAGGKIGASLKKGAVIGVAALGTLAAAGIKAAVAAEDAASVQNKLNKVLENVGKTGATDEVNKLADALQRQTGIDDELIRQGETILASFSAVAESAGVAGGAFEEATRLAVDLAATGFTSVEGASRLLGKALSEPERALGLLRRANIVLSESQQQQIKDFQAVGDTASAQGIVLDAIREKVGGTAEAGAKDTEKLKRGFEEVTESVGNLILALGGSQDKPLKLSDALFKLSDSLDSLSKSDAWELLGKVLRQAGRLVEHLADSVDRLVKAFKAIPDLTLMDFLNPSGRGDPKGSGGRTFASGGRNITSGLALVGEQGPEIIRVPSGSDIYSNRESRQMAGAMGGTVNYIANLYGPTSLSEVRREQDWAAKYGTRYGAATMAGAL